MTTEQSNPENTHQLPGPARDRLAREYQQVRIAEQTVQASLHAMALALGIEGEVQYNFETGVLVVTGPARDGVAPVPLNRAQRRRSGVEAHDADPS